MSDAHRAPRATESDRELHKRLVDGDPTAPVDLVERCLDPLLASLRRKFPHADSRDLEEVAFEALYHLAEEPGRYDPARATLAGYLHLDASRDMLNLLARSKRRAEREISLEAVELLRSGRNRLMTHDPGPPDVVAGQEAHELARTWVETHFTGLDRQVAWLLLTGERQTAPFAEALAISDRPALEQRREVKRAKDRVKARFRRLGARVGEDG